MESYMRECGKSFRVLVGIVAVVLVGTTGLSVRAQQQQASTQASSATPGDAQRFFSGLRWRSIGPARGGRSITAAGSSARPLEYYFGATGGGLWKTTDGGQTWRPVADQALKTSSVGAVAVAESNPDVVYVGMGETELRGNIIQGDGVYKSTDAGKTWTHAGLEKTLSIARIRIHPSNPDLVYVAALGDPYAPNPERGIFKSTDGGKTWKRTLFRDEKTGAVDLVIDPKNPNVLYASLWEVYRTPHSLSSGGPGSGLFKSTDAGDTWTEITRNAGLPKGIVGKSGIAVSGADSNRVYAIVEAQDLPEGGGGVFMSDDAGTTWKMVNDDRRLRQRAFYYTRIYADPKEKDTVYILNTGFYRSTDAGKTIRPIRVPHGDNHDLWIASNDPKRMINSNDGGANVSTNGGETWTEQDFPTAQFYHVTTTSHVPYHVCGAQQDNSTACVPSNGNGDYLYDVGGGESGYIAVDPKDTDVFYAGSYGGLLTRVDKRTGERRAVNPWPDNPMGYASGAMTERFQWTYPIVVSPHDPKVLYATSQHVWRSADDGQTWEKISPDLTRHDPSTLGESGGPITLDQTGVETYATVFTLAPSPVEAGTIWAGSDDGVVHVTRDGGKNWEAITPPDLPEFARISLIEASPHAAGTAYLAANRYQRADRAPYVYKTADYGKTWTKIVNGLAAGDFARAIREDKVRKGLLFLGTETGVFVSFDDGARWQSLRQNLSVTPVHDIAVKDNDVVIATHGRSFYVMDNISVLRQIDQKIMTSAVHLFAPPDATRSVSRGATIDYFLKNDTDKVTIDILDGQGQVVRTFTGSAEEDKKREAAAQAQGQPQAEEEEDNPRRPAPPRVGYKAGMNRLTWDLRYASATEFPNLIMWAGSVRGPIAPPGQYAVRLTAGGETQTQPLRVNRHPLGSATDADLTEQFTLARQINQRVSDANEAVIRIRALKDQIKDRQGKTADKKLTQAATALATKLTDIEGEIYQYRNRSSQDPLNFPIKLNNKLAALQGTVESGDAKPTGNSYVVFKELSGRLDQQLARLETAVKTDVEAFNKLLRGKKLEPIVDKGAPAKTQATQ
jgi:photosystem II stability/assembly factor-like uncharacterized protein